MTGRLVVLGDALLDRDLVGDVERVCPDGPAPVLDRTQVRSRPGGAALAAALAAADGREVVLVTALGRDRAGEELRTLVEDTGVTVVDLGSDGPTGEKTRIRAAGQTLVRVDGGGSSSGAVGPVPPAARTLLSSAAAVLVADYGRGVTAAPAVRTVLGGLPRRVPVVWDPHPRGGEPVPGVRLATPNRDEAARLVPGESGPGAIAVAAQARVLRDRWRAAGVAVTLGAEGALLVAGDGTPLVVPCHEPARGGSARAMVDVCGAGDRFAATAAGLLADGALPSEAVTAAVSAASRFVAAGGAGAFLHASSDGAPPVAHPDPVGAVRDRGGIVVATGGCFDLLHAGHVQMLSGARALGDCLVVLLNSDASVRRLKGPGRPVVPQDDRAAVLAGLACVDAVVVFDEDTPERALADLRPHLWAKGGDYAVSDLPEARLLGAWGGQAVVLPYVPGRSTTTILEEATRHARS